ncbi:hypothetical protein AWB77_00519 [Caballeronia fortuita]|uniref:Uncharacterized protein n=1 Tax=Caballeronia fortuita TaxID=1777138 RepID=A0A157ZBY4_9BURK|nr:hypothetical protein AWB77_00519 [Caballeronia fortuita]
MLRGIRAASAYPAVKPESNATAFKGGSPAGSYELKERYQNPSRICGLPALRGDFQVLMIARLSTLLTRM